MITSIYAAILSFILIGLSINVIVARRRLGVGLSDAGSIEMRRPIRAQANFVEYSPMFLILLGCAEYNHLPWWILHVFGLVFIAGRLMHAYSLLIAENYNNHKLINYPFWRVFGMMCTFITIGFLSVILLRLSVM